MHEKHIVGHRAYLQAGDGEYSLSGIGIPYRKFIFDWSQDQGIFAGECGWEPLGEPENGMCGVYVIRPKHGDFCKVGIASFPETRLASLQTAHWDDLTIHAVVWVWDNRARDLEAASHAIAREAGHEVKREWVRLSPADTLGLVLTCAAALNLEACGSKGILAARNFSHVQHVNAAKAAHLAELQLKASRQGY